jgi:hypothetical protein
LISSPLHTALIIPQTSGALWLDDNYPQLTGKGDVAARRKRKEGYETTVHAHDRLQETYICNLFSAPFNYDTDGNIKEMYEGYPESNAPLIFPQYIFIQDRTVKEVFNTTPLGIRKIVRPKLRWEYDVIQDVKILGLRSGGT